jgi:hypothetical protein
MTFVGITEDEVEFARANGGGALLEQLERHDAFPLTRPDRRSIVANG